MYEIVTAMNELLTTLDFDFATGDLGWVAGFADYPPADEGIYDPRSRSPRTPGRSRNPEPHCTSPATTTVTTCSCTGRSPPPVSGRKRIITSPSPSSSPRSTPRHGGRGGAPGDGVALKAGAVGWEPAAFPDEHAWLRMNLDKDSGGNSGGGVNMLTLGSIAKPEDGNFDYVLVTRSNAATPFTARSSSDGTLWFVFGTDSGFEATTSLYYTHVTVTATQVNIIDVPPTADILDVTPDPRNTAVGTVTIVFNEPVTGVDILGFQPDPEWDGGELGRSYRGRLGASHTLDILSQTAAEGTYLLTLTADGSAIQDTAGNLLVENASDIFVSKLRPDTTGRFHLCLVETPTPTDANGEAAAAVFVRLAARVEPLFRRGLDQHAADRRTSASKRPRSTCSSTPITSPPDRSNTARPSPKTGPARRSRRRAWCKGWVPGRSPPMPATTRFVLLARIPFAPTAGRSRRAATMPPQSNYISPVDDLGLQLSNGAITLAGIGPTVVEMDDPPAPELWPVMYDIDDDGRVGFSDFSYFAAAFQQQVGDPGATYAYASDFDRSGKVAFSDFAYFRRQLPAPRLRLGPAGLSRRFPRRLAARRQPAAAGPARHRP